MKGIQAKHLDDASFLQAVAYINARKGMWAMTYDLQEVYPGVPRKVIIAKCKALIRRGLLRGCACGCRGDFYIPGGEWGD